MNNNPISYFSSARGIAQFLQCYSRSNQRKYFIEFYFSLLPSSNLKPTINQVETAISHLPDKTTGEIRQDVTTTFKTVKLEAPISNVTNVTLKVEVQVTSITIQNIIIHSTDKGYVIAVLNATEYMQKMINLLESSEY